VAWVIADADGLVQPIAADLLGEHGNILRAVVGNSGETVAVDKNFRRRLKAFFAGEGAGIEDVTVGDASVAGEMLAPPPLQLLRGWPTRDDEPPDAANKKNDAGNDRSCDAGMMDDGMHSR